jgi:hypothetical protein
MIDTFRWMFLAETGPIEQTRSIDWVMLVVEILVLAIIAAEGIYSVIRRFRVRRITKRILAFIEEGQALQSKFPPGILKINDAIIAWKNSVQIWVDSVETFLKVECSRQAAATFLHYIPNQLWSDVISEGNIRPYAELLMRLGNLQSIMENPDVYF